MAYGSWLHAREAAEAAEDDHHSAWMTDTTLYAFWFYVLAVIVPPLAVFLERGCGCELVVNVLLSLFGWLPGCCHALYIVFKFESPIYRDPERYSPATLHRVQTRGPTAGEVFQAGSKDEREEEWRKRRGVPPSSSTAGSDSDDDLRRGPGSIRR
ncbi:hypothetical protein JCM3774_005956 [Rhodotorula dairenensis]